jgi:hypothetical protein
LLNELMQAGGELSIHAAERFLGDAAEKGQRRLVLKTMRRHREVLHRNILTWGAGGYALTRLKLHRRAVKWMADWNERPDAGQWMLNNLIFCLHRLGKADLASQVTQRALSLTADGTINHLRIWAAWDRVRAADLAAAASELQKIDPAKIDPYYRFMHQILTALCIADSIDDANRVEKLKQVRVHIQNAEVSVSNHGKTPELRKMRRLTLWMVRQRCGFKTPAWCWGRLAGIVRSLPMKKPVAQSVKQSMNLNYVILVIVIIVVIALLNSLSHH